MAAKKCGYLRMWRIEDKHNGVGLTERYELQRQGIEVAKAGGKHLGRQRVEYPENWEDCFMKQGTYILTVHLCSFIISNIRICL